MPTITTPAQRLGRMLSEGVRLMAVHPGQTSLDVTPDIIAMLDGVQTDLKPSGEARNLFEPQTVGRDVATRVHFPRNVPMALPT
jgi:hypothetical protein